MSKQSCFTAKHMTVPTVIKMDGGKAINKQCLLPTVQSPCCLHNLNSLYCTISGENGIYMRNRKLLNTS